MYSNLLRDIYTSFKRNNEKRTLKALNNILMSIIFKSIRITISFILVPISIDYLNPTVYGVWMTIFSVFMWVQILDIGLGNGLRNRLAEALAKNDIYIARVYVSTAYFILTVLMLIVFSIFVLIYPFIKWGKLFNVSITLWPQVNKTVLIVFSFICLNFIFQLIIRICQAKQEPAYREIIDAFSAILLLILIFLLYKFTLSSLTYYATATCISYTLTFIVFSFILFKTKYKDCIPNLHFVNLRYTKDLLKLGINFFIIQIASVVLFSTDNFLISYLINPKEVTVVSIARRYFGLLFTGFLIIISPLWSAVTDAFHKKEMEWIKKNIRRLIKLWILLCLICVLMLIIANYFYAIWIGERVSIPTSISILTALLIIIRTFGAIFTHAINGFGMLRIQTINAVAGAILNIPLSIFLAKGLDMGTVGIILATVLISLIGASLRYIQYYKIINYKAKGIWAK